MKSSIPRPLVSVVLAVFLLSAGIAFADQVVNTEIPGGDGKEIMDNPRDPEPGTGTIIVHDKDCARKTMKGPKLNNGQPNPEYEACVKAKVEKAKKKGKH